MAHPEEEFQADRPDEPRPADIDRPRRPRRDDYDDDVNVRRQDDDAASTLIPYRNPCALIAYYCGVFSLIPCVGNILGPIALIFGVLGLRFANEYPTAGGKGHAIAGIVLGLITTILYWGLGLFGIIIFALETGGHFH